MVQINPSAIVEVECDCGEKFEVTHSTIINFAIEICPRCGMEVDLTDEWDTITDEWDIINEYYDDMM